MGFKRGQLRYFVTVADEGQITRAAARLHIAQPALSQAIAQLESDLGVELLERHARGVTLTAAGEAFLPKARAAVASEEEVEATARALARAASGTIEIGFIGPPPTMTSPELFAEFAKDCPDAQLSMRDLSFPLHRTLSWLADVDVAFCHPPALEPGVRVQELRREPRAVVAHRSHPLAGREELSVADVIDEAFIGYHPHVQPAWAGFHCLDDHRGEPARELTEDRILTSLQMLGAMGLRRAITLVPLADGMIVQQVLSDVTVIPLRDAHPAVISLVSRAESPHPLIAALAAAAQRVAGAERPLLRAAAWSGLASDVRDPAAHAPQPSAGAERLSDDPGRAPR